MVRQILARRVVLVLVLVAIFATGALASDYIYTNFLFGSKAYPLPVSSTPCFSQHPVQMQVYDGSAWFVWTCADGRVIPVRFFHPNDQAELTRVVPVRIIADQPEAYNSPVPAPTYDTTNPNWNGTGMTEAQWRARYPVR